MSQSTFKLVYVSSASYPMTQNEMMILLEKSRKTNVQLDITGLLLCYEDNFFQLLEGEEQRVLQLYAKIAADPRHKGLLKLFSETTSSREFPEWSMGYKLIDQDWDVDFRDGLNDIFKKGSLDLNDVVISGVSNKVHKLLESFKQISGMPVA